MLPTRVAIEPHASRPKAVQYRVESEAHGAWRLEYAGEAFLRETFSENFDAAMTRVIHFIEQEMRR